MDGSTIKSALASLEHAGKPCVFSRRPQAQTTEANKIECPYTQHDGSQQDRWSSADDGHGHNRKGKTKGHEGRKSGIDSNCHVVH